VSTILQLLKYLVAGAAGLAGFSLLAQYLAWNVFLDRPAMEASATYFRMESDAMTAYPHDGPLLALAKYSHEQAMKQMTGAANDATRAKIAASIFLGYWQANGRARGELCAQNGVDIGKFVREFEDHHANLHARARALLKDEEVSEDRLYEINRDAMLNHVSYEMLYLHDGVPMSIRDSCARLLEQSFIFIPKMNFANLEPWVANTVLAGR
jgi:hypothetical protein